MNSQNESQRLGSIEAPPLFISARTIADSLHHGRHASARRGASTEFYDFRPYVPGDPVRLLDWRALARTDRAYLRRFHHEGQLSVTIVLDASASMAFSSMGSAGGASAPSKFRRAQELAAAIAMITVRQSDRAGLVVGGGVESAQGARVVPPGAGQPSLRQIIGSLEQSQPSVGRRDGQGRELIEAIAAAGAITPRGGLVVVISDALDEAGPMLDALASVRFAQGRHRDVALIQVLAPEEMDISGIGAARLVDPESGVAVNARADRCAGAYAAALRAHIESLRSGIGRLNGRYGLCLTSKSPLDALHAALAR